VNAPFFYHYGYVDFFTALTSPITIPKLLFYPTLTSLEGSWTASGTHLLFSPLQSCGTIGFGFLVALVQKVNLSIVKLDF